MKTDNSAMRRKNIEESLGIDLTQIGRFTLDETIASTRHCENMIGAVQVPLGIAGPLQIKDHHSKIKEYLVPLATTEGALVASINRGCKAITLSGGVSVISKKIGITRAPVFVVENIAQGNKFIAWIEEHAQLLKEIIENTSSHLTLLDIKPWTMGKNVFLRFRMDSGEAMGMNMATIAVSKAVEIIEDQTEVKCAAVSGNMCVDKKTNTLNFIEGRGYRVSSDIVIPAAVLHSVLKTSAKNFFETSQRKLVYGSQLSGTIGANAHVANVLAAMFLATGQDLAHIAESSMGITTVELQGEDGIYVSIYLPDLPVGTIGGGTELATQQEALSIMGIRRGEKDSAQKFAEIIGATVLAGEISLLASLAQGSLARAHQRLGRGGK